MIFLPTEPQVILAMAAARQGCAPDCWHCRAWARMCNAPFPFAQAAAAPSPVVGPPSAAGGGTGASREPVGSGKSPVAPVRSTSEYGPGRVLHLLLGGRP